MIRITISPKVIHSGISFSFSSRDANSKDGSTRRSSSRSRGSGDSTTAFVKALSHRRQLCIHHWGSSLLSIQLRNAKIVCLIFLEYDEVCWFYELLLLKSMKFSDRVNKFIRTCQYDLAHQIEIFLRGLIRDFAATINPKIFILPRSTISTCKIHFLKVITPSQDFFFKKKFIEVLCCPFFCHMIWN